jgi:hypothetical protein
MTMRTVLIAAVVLALAAACSEKPPRPDPERGVSLNLQKGPNTTAERTLNQGEHMDD